MAGSEKLKLLVIGKSKKPRCFKHVKSLPVQYEANIKAWMTGEMFASWLWKMDRDFERQKRKVLFFVDNCTAHPNVSGLCAIKVIFLPPNTTSKLQPMDQGIIKNLKFTTARTCCSDMLQLSMRIRNSASIFLMQSTC